MTLVRLLYASRAAAPVKPEELASILRQAKGNNPAQGITGVLCCSDDMFLQVLEGGRTAVNRLYARIVADRRVLEIYHFLKSCRKVSKNLAEEGISVCSKTINSIIKTERTRGRKKLPARNRAATMENHLSIQRSS